MPDKILVVDDEPDPLNLTKRILERNGYRVFTASDGDEALQKVNAEPPDLILLDIVMQGKDGVEVCKILKSKPKTRRIPVVMFTVLGRDVDIKRATDAGCDGYVTRPFVTEDLLAEIKKHLGQAEAKK
ncbi:response regulator [Candidatus Bathyarchaeota archaeon]|nr:response regulator [Candidatus Bathyarchaeota archaeon]